MAHSEPIRSRGRLCIRHASPGDEASFMALRRSSTDFLAPWEPIRDGDGHEVPPDLVLFRNMVEFESSQRIPMLLERLDDRVILGAININEISRGFFQNCALGWWVGKQHARNGYMKEGLELALEHVFLDLDLHRAEANIQPENIASRALACGAGLKQEGFSESFLKIHGQWSDHERWAITSELWNETRT
jgi:ribosomal-protein-alanine N-acetyltransferase